MVRDSESGNDPELEACAFQFAARAAEVGVAVEEGGYLKLLNQPAIEQLLFADGQTPSGLGACRIPLESLPQRFQDPQAFQSWRETLLANLPDSTEPPRLWTRTGRLLQIDFSTVENGEDGVFTWSIRDCTTREKAALDLERASRSEKTAKEEKTRLLAMMSHEVRTPMNAILGMTELLLHTPLSREQWNLLDTARTAGESLIGILDNVLDIAKVESGNLPLARRPFSLADLVEGLAEEIAPSVAEAGLEVACVVDAAIPRILEGDPDKVRQVLSNVMGNAVKFTRQGSVTITAEPVERGGESPWFRLSVEDTGTGISGGAVDRVFEPFFQAGIPEDGEREGVGLGLSIVRSFVDLMGGQVTVESFEGRGTRFDVSIPLFATDSAFPMRRAADLEYPEFHAILLSPSERIRVAAGHVFESLGVGCALSRDPEDLTSRLGASDPESRIAVFVDHRLGEAELDWIRHQLSLRRDDLDLSLVVLVPPGFEQPGRRGEALRMFHLPKPLTRRAVAGVFQEIQGKKVEREPGGGEEAPGPSELAGLRVLLVEDRDENRHYLSRVLNWAGVEVDSASDGEIGLIQFRNGSYDLVLTDLDMPGLDGYGLLEGIRTAEREEGWGRVPVVAITAHTDPTTTDRCFKVGMDAFVTKPVGRKDLLRVVGDLARKDPRILVVEDDPRSREVTCQILQDRGFRAEGVATGEAALKRVGVGGIAAVLLDMTLPDISGLEVARRIRTSPRSEGLPVIGVTGHAGQDQAAVCRQAG